MTELIKIPVENLKIGHYIVLPFGWKNHPFLFSSFRIKDEEQLKVLRDLGLKQIPVNLEKSTITAEEVSEPEPLPEEPEPVIELPDPHKARQTAARRSIRQAERNRSPVPH